MHAKVMRVQISFVDNPKVGGGRGVPYGEHDHNQYVLSRRKM